MEYWIQFQARWYKHLHLVSIKCNCEPWQNVGGWGHWKVRASRQIRGRDQNSKYHPTSSVVFFPSNIAQLSRHPELRTDLDEENLQKSLSFRSEQEKEDFPGSGREGENHPAFVSAFCFSVLSAPAQAIFLGCGDAEGGGSQAGAYTSESETSLWRSSVPRACCEFTLLFFLPLFPPLLGPQTQWREVDGRVRKPKAQVSGQRTSSGGFHGTNLGHWVKRVKWEDREGKRVVSPISSITHVT